MHLPTNQEGPTRPGGMGEMQISKGQLGAINRGKREEIQGSQKLQCGLLLGRCQGYNQKLQIKVIVIKRAGTRWTSEGVNRKANSL